MIQHSTTPLNTKHKVAVHWVHPHVQTMEGLGSKDEFSPDCNLKRRTDHKAKAAARQDSTAIVGNTSVKIPRFALFVEAAILLETWEFGVNGR